MVSSLNSHTNELGGICGRLTQDSPLGYLQSGEGVGTFGGGRRGRGVGACSTLEVTHGQILSQSPTDATRFRWRLYWS